MFHSDGSMRQKCMDHIRPSRSSVNATPSGIAQVLDGQNMRVDGKGCAEILPCVVDAAIPTIPQGLDRQGVLITQYMRDLVCTLLEAMQLQIASLECAVLLASPDKRHSLEVRMCDSEVAPDIDVKCATEVAHQAAPSDIETSKEDTVQNDAAGKKREDTEGDTAPRVAQDGIKLKRGVSVLSHQSSSKSVESSPKSVDSSKIGILRRGFSRVSSFINRNSVSTNATKSDRPSRVERLKRGFSFPFLGESTDSSMFGSNGMFHPRISSSSRMDRATSKVSSNSGSHFVEGTRRDLETHQLMQTKARIRSCFTSDGKPLMLSPSRLLGVLQRKGFQKNYDLPLLEAALQAMYDVRHVILHEDSSPRNNARNSGDWRDAIESSRFVATLTVSHRLNKDDIGSDSRSVGSEDGIIDLDIFTKLLLSPDLVRIVDAQTGDSALVDCIHDIQRVCLEEDTIHDIVHRLACSETSSFDWEHTCRTSDRIEFLTVIVSVVALVLEVDRRQDWMGWVMIEFACTSLLTLLIAWKVHAESLKTYFCGETWKWNLIDASCTAVAIGAMLARLATGEFYTVRLTMAIRLLRGFRMQPNLYRIPVLREATIISTGVIISLPYMLCAVILMLALTLTTGVATKLAVGPSAGQDLASQCGAGDDYYSRASDPSDECLLVSLYSEEFLDSVANAMMTAFRCITGSCTTKEGFSLDLIFSEYYGAGFVIAYVAVICAFLFGIVNILTAVLVDIIHRDLKTRWKHCAPSSHDVYGALMELKELVREVVQADDHDLPLNLTRSEFSNIMKDNRVRSIFHELDVYFDNGFPAFDLFDFDGDEYVRESDFYSMLLKMRGSIEKADVVGSWLSLRDQRKANDLNHLAILDAQQSVYRQLQRRNAAVMLYRVDKGFEDDIQPSCGQRCIVSFPGRHVFEWQCLVQLCKKGQLNSACVYLPKDDPQHRYGRHCNNPATPGSCYCWSLYGGPQEWGCKWFTQWTKQVQRAVEFKMELVVVFFEGQQDCGMVDWKDLASADLWDGIGLGGSQKGEVAWLKQQGLAFTSMDLHEAAERFQLKASRTSSSSSSQELSPFDSSGKICALYSL